jgi:hypothetical protein
VTGEDPAEERETLAELLHKIFTKREEDER